MAILSHAMQEQVWTFLRIYTPEANLFFLALPLELLSPVPLPARGLGRMPVHHGISMQRKLPSRRSKWLAAQPAVSTEPAAYPRLVNGMGRFTTSRGSTSCVQLALHRQCGQKETHLKLGNGAKQGTQLKATFRK